jgi:hypothetical protein
MKRMILVMIAALLLLAPAARAETVYQFAALCNAEQLGHCFNRIETRLVDLDKGTHRRICLPASFGAMLSNVIPVSLLERVRLRVSAARFGEADADVDDVIVRAINEIYPCDPSITQQASARRAKN